MGPWVAGGGRLEALREAGVAVHRLLVGLKEHGLAGQQVSAQAGLEIQDGLSNWLAVTSACVEPERW